MMQVNSLVIELLSKPLLLTFSIEIQLASLISIVKYLKSQGGRG